MVTIAAGLAATSNSDLISGRGGHRWSWRAAWLPAGGSIIPAVVATLLLASPASPQTGSVSGGRSDDGPTFEGQPITAIEIDTHVRFDANKLLELTGIGTGRRFDAKAVRTSVDRLYDTGLFSTIAIEAARSPDGVSLVYHLWAKQRIREFSITGHGLSYSPAQLRTAMKLAVGDEFSREGLETAIAHLLQFYTRHGYMQARVIPSVTIQPNHTDVRLLITVQEGPPALIGKVILSGQLGLAEKDVRKRLDLTPGAPYTADEVNSRIAELQRLYAKEHFLLSVIEPAATQYEPAANRVTVTLTIHAGPRITIHFPGNPYWFSDSKLRERLLIQTERSIDEDVLDASAERMRNMLHDDGYLTATVNAQRKDSPDHERVAIDFRITAGPRFSVGRLIVTGAQNDHVSQWRKPLLMRPTMLGLSHPAFDPAAWEEDLARVRQWYGEHGFLSASVEGRLALQNRAGTVEPTIAVQEGPQTRIGRMTFSGNRHVPDELLGRSVHARPGQPYNPAQVRADRLALVALYSGKGYLEATVTLDPQMNDAHTEVALPFVITEGSPTFVGTIIIEGNKDTDEAVLRRELVIYPAGPYDDAAILRSRHNLAQLGIFRDIKFVPVEPRRSDMLQDIKLSVNERPAGAFEFGAGFASEEKFRGFVQLSHKNLAGTGRRVTARVQADFLDQRYLLNYVEPWAAGLPLDLRMTILYESKQDVSFKRQTYGATAGFDKNLTDQLKFSLLYRFSRDRYDIDPGAHLPPDELERVNVGSISPGLVLDLRDDPFNPTRGSIESLTLEDAALSLGSEVQFLKATGSSSWFLSPLRRVVFAFSARGGIVKEFGSTPSVPLGERFYLGGQNTVRGYRQDKLGVLQVIKDPNIPGNVIIGPASTLSSSGDPIGGNVMLLTNIEARIALPAHLGLVFFLDGGNVWTTAGTVNLTEMKFSVGTGIRYNTPVGPLRLDCGFKLRREDVSYPTATPPIRVDESPYEINFTLGNAF
jgi:outer membrane protein insertion porin family